MPNTYVRAAAEGMPALNRRHMLIGLAVASTAAATVTVAPAAHSSELEGLIAAHVAALTEYDAVRDEE